MIKTLIDSLSYSKLNVFHWHLTDTQSFPLYLDSLPMFAEYGAYSPEMTYNKVRHTLTSDLSDTKLSSSAPKSSIRRFVIKEKAPTRAFSWMKAATTAFTFKDTIKTLC